MRRLSLVVVTAIVAALAVVVSAPLGASAATLAAYTSEVGPNTIANRTAANGQPGQAWTGAVTTAGGVASAPITFTTPSYSAGGAITGVIRTTTDGTAISVKRTQYTAASSPLYVADSSNPGTAECTTNGQTLQGAAPRPSSLVDTSATAPTPPNCSSAGGFAYSESGGTGENTTRDAVEFSFSKPVLAFGAWFGDLETRTIGGGLPAIVRLYGPGNTLLSDQNIVPSTADQSLCGGSFTGCGNGTTRWLGFVADPTQAVARMVVIVGDDDAVGTGLDEGIGFIGAMVAAMPQLAVTKTVVSGYPINRADGTYDVKYTVAVSNTGGSTLSSLGLVDNLATTFSPIASASIAVQSTTLTPPTLTGSVGALNATTYNGTTVTQLLNTATSKLVPGDSLSVAIVVRITPAANLGSYANNATASGTSGTTTVTATNASPASVTLSESRSMVATKTVASTVSNGNGTQTIGFAVKIENTSNVKVTGLDVVDALGTAFGAQLVSATVPVITVPPGSSSSVVPNPAFDGTTNTHLVLTSSYLATSDNVTMTLSMTIAATSGAPGSNSVQASATAPSGTLVNATSSVPVAFTFTGSVKLTKVVAGGPGGLSSTFPFTLNCGTNGVFSPSVTVAGATGSATVSGIPARSTCSVSEGTLPVAPAGYSWSGTTYSGTPASVVDAAITEVTVTNTLTRDTGSVRIDANIVGGPSGGTTATFPFALTCGPNSYSPAVAVSASAGTTTAAAIPTSSCTIAAGTLPAAPIGYSWGSPTVSPSSFMLATSPVQVVVFTIPVTLNTGSVRIDATITGGPSGGTTTVLPVVLACGTNNYGPAIPLTASTGSSTTGSIPSPASCSVSAGTLPTPPAGYTWSTPVLSSASVAVATGGTSVVSYGISLSRDTGAVEATVQVTGAPIGGISGSFPFTFTCGSGGPYSASVVLTAATSGSTTVASIPAPTSCTPASTSLPNPPAGYTWGTPTLSPATLPVTSGATVTTTLTLPLVRDTGSLQVGVTITGGPAGGVTAVFPLTATCDTGGPYSTSIAIVAASSGTATIAAIPATASCTAAPGTLPTAPVGYSWGTPVVSPVGAVQVTSGSTATVAFTIPLVRDTGSTQVAVAISGAPSGGVNGTFGFELACDTGGPYAASVVLAGTASGSTSVAGIPAPATCSAASTSVPAAPAGYTWGGATLTPASGSVSFGGTTTFTYQAALVRDTGSARVTVTINGAPTGGASGTFPFILTCGTGGPYPVGAVLSGSSSGSVLASGIPAPASCTAAVGTLPTAPSGYSWGAAMLTPPSGTISAGATTAFAYSIELVRDTGSVQIAFAVTGAPPEGASGLFPFTVTCDTGGPYSTSVTLAAATTGTVTVAGIPAPANCSVTSGLLPPSPGGYNWGIVQLSTLVFVTDGATAQSASSVPLVAQPALAATGLAAIVATGIATILIFLGGIVLFIQRRIGRPRARSRAAR